MLKGILQHNEIKEFSEPVEDIKTQVLPLIPDMIKYCNLRIGKVKEIVALAHCQVERKNPLTFFTFRNGITIVNPEIISKGPTIMHQEGCASLAFRPEKKVRRSQKIYCKYTMIEENEIKEIEEWLYNFTACVFQHEIDHFKNKYIY